MTRTRTFLLTAVGAAAFATPALAAPPRTVAVTKTVAPGTKGRIVARCPAGTYAMGGGFKTTGVGANDSFPLLAGGHAVGWVLTTHKPKTPATGTATAGSATVYAICRG